MKRFILLSALFCCLKTGFAQPGELDSSFGANGIVTSDFGIETYYNCIAIQSDGKIVAAGYTFTGSLNMIVARYNIDGSPDNSFSDDGIQISDYFSSANSAIIQHDGKILVAAPGGITRYSINGKPDNTFSNDGILTTDFDINSLAIQSDGKIVGVGYATNGSNLDFALVRYYIDGSLDNSFSDDGKQITDFSGSSDQANLVAIQSDGKVVVAGASDFNFALVRYNIDGSPDYSFSNDGKQTTDFSFLENVTSLSIQSDGKIVAGGNINVNGESDFCLARYNADGSLDDSFSDDGKQTADFSPSDFSVNNSVAVQSDGKIVMGGNSDIFDNHSGFTLTRYNTDGSVDLTFSNDGKQTTNISEGADLLYSIIIADNKLYAVGFGEFPNHRGIVARYLLDDENKAPTVNISILYNIVKYTAPARIKINATATDEDGTISKVEFYNGTTLIDTEDVFPYGTLLDNVPVGNYTLTAKATDNSGNITTSNSIEVSVVNENVPPVVSIVSPADDTTYTGPATIQLLARAKDANDRVSKVEFYNGNTLLTTERYGPYRYTWTNVPPGTYTITAKATDDKGLSATSDAVTITIAEPNVQMISNRLSVSSKTNLSGVSLKLSPNPASNILHIYTNGLQRNKRSTTSVISALGVIIKTIQTRSNQKMQMDVSSLRPGVYFLKVLNGGKVLYTQFVKL